MHRRPEPCAVGRRHRPCPRERCDPVLTRAIRFGPFRGRRTPGGQGHDRRAAHPCGRRGGVRPSHARAPWCLCHGHAGITCRKFHPQSGPTARGRAARPAAGYCLVAAEQRSAWERPGEDGPALDRGGSRPVLLKRRTARASSMVQPPCQIAKGAVFRGGRWLTHPPAAAEVSAIPTHRPDSAPPGPCRSSCSKADRD